MTAEQIPSFVQEIIAAGCDICAIGHRGYVLGELEELDAAEDELDRIFEVYGRRDHLLLEIAAHLRSLGRFLDIGGTAAHWTENKKE
ncbi:hypothetical protein [Rhodopseudomonas parapalustris]